jgi:hypothetical protein
VWQRDRIAINASDTPVATRRHSTATSDRSWLTINPTLDSPETLTKTKVGIRNAETWNGLDEAVTQLHDAKSFFRS